MTLLDHIAAGNLRDFGFLEAKPRFRVRIREGWDQAGRRGTLYGFLWQIQAWAAVVWDDEEDPDFVKAAALERAHDERPLCGECSEYADECGCDDKSHDEDCTCLDCMDRIAGHYDFGSEGEDA